MGTIYKITNTVNGKSYIGQTIHDAEKTRIADHLNGKGKGNKLIRKDLEVYGKEVFTYEILHDGIIPEFLRILEDQEIEKHNCVDPDGYNEMGAKNSPSRKTRKKMSEALKGNLPWNKGKKISNPHWLGRKHTEESRQKMSEAQKGKASWNKGKTLSEEHRRKLSEAHKGKKQGPHSEEHRLKLSQSHKGKKHSKATLEKMSKNRKGKPVHPNTLKSAHSKESRHKMSETKLGMSRKSLTILIGWLLRDGWSQSKIARELRKTRETISKYKP